MRVLASSTSELLELVNSRAHPFVVGFRFALMDASFAYIGMHHVGGGDLFSVLQQHGPFPPDGAKIYVAEVVLALAHLHSFDVVHQDVKPENVLVELDGHLKLADLGSAMRMVGRVGSVPPPFAEGMLVGSPEHMAPENMLARLACENADVWSVGCLACEILTGSSPFAAADGDVETLVFNVVQREIELPLHAYIGPAEAAFLAALLRREPHERLGAREHGGASAIIEHDWFGHTSARAFLTKQVAPPWVPHLNGPAYASGVAPPSVELLAMADAALAPPLPPSMSALPHSLSFASFGEPAQVVGAGTPPLAESVVPVPAFIGALSAPSAAAAAEAAAEEDPGMWSNYEQSGDDAEMNQAHATEEHAAEEHAAEGHAAEGHAAEGHAAEGHAAEGHAAEGHAGGVQPQAAASGVLLDRSATAATATPKNASCDDGSPISSLDVHQLEPHKKATVADGFSSRSSSCDHSSSSSSVPPAVSFKRTDVKW